MKSKKTKNCPYKLRYAQLGQDNKLSLSWGAAGIGFGSMYLSVCPKSGKALFDTEFMGREFVKAALCRLVDESVFTDFENLTSLETALSLEELNEYSICGAIAKSSEEFSTINYPELIWEEQNAILQDKNPTKGHTIKVYLSTEISAKLANQELEYTALIEQINTNGFRAEDVEKSLKVTYTISLKE